jgi:RNA recognition motif-containing protein
MRTENLTPPGHQPQPKSLPILGCDTLFSHIMQIAEERARLSPMNIYIGNLSYSTSEDSLKTMFTEFGEVESVKLIKDRFTGRSKGFGFVEMPSNSEADQAIKALNGSLVDGSNIKVRPADPGGKQSKKSSFRRRSY